MVVCLRHGHAMSLDLRSGVCLLVTPAATPIAVAEPQSHVYPIRLSGRQSTVIGVRGSVHPTA